MQIRKCKIFESSTITTLQHSINEWLDEFGSTIQILETNQSECAYASSVTGMPSMRVCTITIWYEHI